MQVKGIESILALLYGTGVLLAESIAQVEETSNLREQLSSQLGLI